MSYDHKRIKLKINKNKISRKPQITGIYSLKTTTTTKTPQVKEEIKRDIRKYYKLNDNENPTYRNLWDVVSQCPEINL